MFTIVQKSFKKVGDLIILDENSSISQIEIFDDYSDCLKYREKLEIKQFKNLTLHQYFSKLEDVCKDLNKLHLLLLNHFKDELKLCRDDMDEFFSEPIGEASDSDILELRKLININFYRIIEK